MIMECCFCLFGHATSVFCKFKQYFYSSYTHLQSINCKWKRSPAVYFGRGIIIFLCSTSEALVLSVLQRNLECRGDCPRGDCTVIHILEITDCKERGEDRERGRRGERKWHLRENTENGQWKSNFFTKFLIQPQIVWLLKRNAQWLVFCDFENLSLENWFSYVHLFFSHGHIFQVFFYFIFVCVGISKCFSCYTKLEWPVCYILISFIFMSLCFANDFWLKVTLCNNNVRCSPFGDWSMQVLELYIVMMYLVYCRMARLFAYQVWFVIKHENNWYDYNPSSYMCLTPQSVQ